MEKLGLQLYSLKELTQKDFFGTLSAVAKAGYDGVEFAGYFDTPAKALRKVLDDCGLKACGSHIAMDAINKDLDGLIAYSQEIGSPYIVCPAVWGDMVGSADAWKRTAERFNEVGQKCVENGILFGYHNHDFEFVKYGDKMAYDIMLENTDPENLFLELDIYWVEFAGMNLPDFLRKYNKRIRLLHMKDMKSLEDKRNTVIGDGIIDMPATIAVGKELGVEWYIVEQEEYEKDAILSVTEGLQYLRSVT